MRIFFLKKKKKKKKKKKISSPSALGHWQHSLRQNYRHRWYLPRPDEALQGSPTTSSAWLVLCRSSKMEQYCRSWPSTRTTELRQSQRHLLTLDRGQSVYLDPLDPPAVFIMVEFEKLLYIPDLKMVLIFLVTKVFQKGIMFKMSLCFTLTRDSMWRNVRRQGVMVAWVCTAVPSLEKNWPLGSPVKLAFRWFLLTVEHTTGQPSKLRPL